MDTESIGAVGIADNVPALVLSMSPEHRIPWLLRLGNSIRRTALWYEDFDDKATKILNKMLSDILSLYLGFVWKLGRYLLTLRFQSLEIVIAGCASFLILVAYHYVSMFWTVQIRMHVSIFRPSS